MNYRLYLTENCNLNCKYCYEGEKTKKEANINNIKKIIDYEIKQKNSYSLINFYGGEPLLRKDLIYETINYIKSKKTKTKFRYGLATNGMLLDDDFLNYMNRNNFTLIAYSIDGDKEIQNLNRMTVDGKETFDIVQKNAKKALKRFKNVVGMVTVTKNTLSKLSKSVEYLIELGFKIINLQFDYTARWFDNDLQEIQKQYNNIAKIYYNNIIKNNYIEIIPLDEKIKMHIYNNDYVCSKACTLGMENLYVDVDGNIYPCIQFVGNNNFIIGNCENGVDVERRTEIIKSAFKEAEVCKKCAVRKRCNHTCACKNYIIMGDINKVAPIICETEKIFIETADSLATKIYNTRPKAFIRKYYNKDGV